MKSNIYHQPRLAGTASASYIGENQAIPTSQPSFADFMLTAKKLVSFVPVTRELVEDSDPAIETIIREDLMRQLGLQEDYTWLLGVGSANTPQGILSRSDITAVGPTDATNGDAATYDMTVNMQTQLKKANVPLINPVWICNPEVEGAFRKVKDSYGHPIFTEWNNVQNSTLNYNVPSVAMKPSGTLYGRPVFTTTQLPITTLNTHRCGDLALVEMSQVKAGQRGTIEMDSTREATFIDNNGNVISAYQADLVLFRGIVRHDINVLHPAAIVVQKDVQV